MSRMIIDRAQTISDRHKIYFLVTQYFFMNSHKQNYRDV